MKLNIVEILEKFLREDKDEPTSPGIPSRKMKVTGLEKTVARNPLKSKVRTAPGNPPPAPGLGGLYNLKPVSKYTMDQLRKKEAEQIPAELPPPGEQSRAEPFGEPKDPFDPGDRIYGGYSEELPPGMSIQDYLRQVDAEAQAFRAQNPKAQLDPAFSEFEPTEEEEKEIKNKGSHLTPKRGSLNLASLLKK